MSWIVRVRSPGRYSPDRRDQVLEQYEFSTKAFADEEAQAIKAKYQRQGLKPTGSSRQGFWQLAEGVEMEVFEVVDRKNNPAAHYAGGWPRWLSAAQKSILDQAARPGRWWWVIGDGVSAGWSGTEAGAKRFMRRAQNEAQRSYGGPAPYGFVGRWV